MPYTADGQPARSPRLKPALDTAGDVSYAAAQRERIRQQLRQLLESQQQRAEEQQRRIELESHISDVAWAERWIADHGGTIAAALKATHPDTGGSAQHFAITQKAREILGQR